jgi:hypothetical protein
MGTSPVEKEGPVGYIDRASGAISEVYEKTVEVTYGKRGGSLYPVVLLAVIAAGLVIGGAISTLVGVGCTLLLAIWVGGGGRQR